MLRAGLADGQSVVRAGVGEGGGGDMRDGVGEKEGKSKCGLELFQHVLVS